MILKDHYLNPGRRKKAMKILQASIKNTLVTGQCYTVTSYYVDVMEIAAVTTT